MNLKLIQFEQVIIWKKKLINETENFDFFLNLKTFFSYFLMNFRIRKEI